MAEISFDIVRLTTQRKIDARFLTIQLMPEQEEGQPGILFALIDIDAPWTSSARVGQAIINALVRGYRGGTSSSVMENFETALELVDRTLAELIQGGETAWVDKIHGLLGLLNENNLHLSATGQARAYLFRGEKISHITQDTQASTSTRTFSTIISGALEPGDWVVCGNPALFGLISPSHQNDLLKNQTIDEAGLLFAKTLQRHRRISANALLLTPAIGRRAQTQTIYLDRSIESLGHRLGRFWQGVIVPSARFGGHHLRRLFLSAAHFVKTKVAPQAATLARKTAVTGQQLGQKALQKSAPLVKKGLEKIGRSQEDNGADISLIGSTLYSIHEYQRREEKPSLAENLWRGLTRVLRILQRWVILVWRWLIAVKNRRLSVLAMVVVAAIILFGSIAREHSLRQEKQSSLNQKQAIEQARTKLSAGKTALIFKDETTAVSDFAATLALLQPLTGQNISEIDDLAKQAQIQYDQQTATTRYPNQKPLASSSGSHLLISGGNAYAANSSSINLVNLTTGETRLLANLSGLNRLVFNGQDLLAATAKNELFGISSKTGALTSVKLPDTKFGAGPIETFGANLYQIDAQNKLILKYPGSMDGGWDKSTTYQSANELAGASALAIDGSIYVLYHSGSLDKYTRTGKGELKLTNLPPPEKLVAPLLVHSDSAGQSIWLVDNGDQSTPARLLQIDKSGAYQHQYILPIAAGKVSDVQIDESAKKAWVLGDGKLFELNL